MDFWWLRQGINPCPTHSGCFWKRRYRMATTVRRMRNGPGGDTSTALSTSGTPPLSAFAKTSSSAKATADRPVRGVFELGRNCMATTARGGEGRRVASGSFLCPFITLNRRERASGFLRRRSVGGEAKKGLGRRLRPPQGRLGPRTLGGCVYWKRVFRRR